jgi:signal transduction histidine kinase
MFSTRLRLLLLLGCLIAVFLAAAWALRTAHQRESGQIRAAIEQQRRSLLDRMLALTGQSLATFSSDYALWDEMVAFLRSGDREWARVNLDASLPNFGAHAAWVLRLDGTPVYQTAGSAAFAAPWSRAAFLARLTQEKNLHFFHESPAGLWEIRTAPIQPSADIQRTSPPLGWWIVARLWDEHHLQTLRDALQFDLSFAPFPGSGSDPALIHIDRQLDGWDGRPVRTLHTASSSPALTRLLQGNQDEWLVFLLFGVLFITVASIGLSRWVLTPLRHIGRGLETGLVAPLQPLQARRDEFGHLARLVEQSFLQRTALEHEVAERTRMARELETTGTRLAESIELRARLARDLHDGVIQSIYAAGLGLEGARDLLRTDPAAADLRLQACLNALNETIRDVRNFIGTLESDDANPRPFAQALATLVATLQSIHPGEITLTVDDALARRLGPGQELHLLQFLRESIGNALRHASARSIRVSLLPAENFGAELTVLDDGCGFDPTRTTGLGRGLHNLRIRAQELGASLRLDSAPASGTRISLRFTPAYPP